MTTTSERQGRLPSTTTRAPDGKEKAGGLLLMTITEILKTDELIARRYRRLSRQASAQGPCCASSPAAGRRRQVDADRPPALRQQDDLRGPAGGAGADSKRVGTVRRGHRLRAAGRRPGPSASRASPSMSPTASSPPTSASSSSPTRRATSNTPATWHRRLDRGPRGDSDRRAQRRADQTRRHSFIASLLGIRTSCWRSTRWTWSTMIRSDSSASSPTIATFAEQIGIGPFQAIPISGLKGDNITAEPQ
jgi:hypothetical protein